MTIDDFVREVQGYYGCRYKPGQLKYIKQFLKKQPEKRLGVLMGEVFKNFSASYKVPPGIAELEAGLKIIRKERYAELSTPDAPQLVEPEYIEVNEEKLNTLLNTMRGLAKKKNRRKK